MEYDSTDLILKASYMIGVLVIGNIIDNVSTPKYLSMALQFSLAITWLSTSALVYYIQKTYPAGTHLDYELTNIVIKLVGLA